MTNQPSNRVLQVISNTISIIFVAICVVFAWSEEYIWAGMSLIGVLVFSNLPQIIDPASRESKEERALKKELNKF